MIKRSFGNIKYGSYPRNVDSDDLTIEYEQMLFTKWTIDRLTDNIVENFNVSSIKQSFDNRIYESNTQNAYLYDLPFGGDERLITRKQLYNINDNIDLRLNNSLSIDI